MNQETFEFVVYMIHACANKWHMTPMEVYKRIEQEGCVSKKPGCSARENRVLACMGPDHSSQVSPLTDSL